ncbi:folate synthesis bifunctional protein, mitochondrial-like isoform X2 [Wolffia australiana]
MRESGIHITRHACLYESEPAYVTNQPNFLNSAVRGITKLSPHELLAVLKKIEKDLGRKGGGIRYGPRPIDLDILFYGRLKISSEALTVPHQRIWERPFVLAPVVDLLGSYVDSDVTATWHSLSGFDGGVFEAWNRLGGESTVGSDGLKRVLPLPNGGGERNRLWEWSKKTHLMGVVNLTQDSFSDGGEFNSVDSAVSQIRRLVSEGADMVDLGAQSTRPKARRVSVDEELDRLLPVVEAAFQRVPELEEKKVLLSVDTFYSEVASEAVNSGAHMVNDVSAGQIDPKMFDVVAGLDVPYVAMHMRGDPSTMQEGENIRYDDVCREVASELGQRISKAEISGIPAWNLIIDPGIGFSKTTEQNLEILMGLPRIREELGKRSLAASHGPLLVGPSRKRFLGEICGRVDPKERDAVTVAAVTTGILGGADIVRAHNMGFCSDAAKLCDALLKKGR